MEIKQHETRPKFLIGLFWGCLLSIPLWALFLYLIF